MVFSSFPAIYLDQPNLQQFQEQQQPNHHQLGSGVESSQIQPPPPHETAVVGGPPPDGGVSIRPRSMIDRARLAKIPLPEAGLKCPRCDSSNTKFCYFNNYNLSQPRHFCKTCRRYWTRGGALRNVPVGGGCRRNKKSKSSSSKSTVPSDRNVGASSTRATNPCPSNSTIPMSMSMTSSFPQTGTLMPAFHNLNHYAGGPIGSNLGGFPANMGFSLGNNLGLNSGNDLPAGGVETWRLSPIGGYEGLTSNLFPFQGEGIDATSAVMGDQQLGSMPTSSGFCQLSNAKSEEILEANLTKQFHIDSENGQFWSGNPWTGFSGLSSSSTSHLL